MFPACPAAGDLPEKLTGALACVDPEVRACAVEAVGQLLANPATLGAAASVPSLVRASGDHMSHSACQIGPSVSYWFHLCCSGCPTLLPCCYPCMPHFWGRGPRPSSLGHDPLPGRQVRSRRALLCMPNRTSSDPFISAMLCLCRSRPHPCCCCAPGPSVMLDLHL
jgi:hypothetical protein